MSTMTNFPVTRTWLDKWETNVVSLETEFGLTLNDYSFTIASVNNSYGMQGNMSVKKQVKNGQTVYWWGYSTQLNFKTALTQGAVLQNWMQIYGQDKAKPTNFMNFMCQLKQTTVN